MATWHTFLKRKKSESFRYYNFRIKSYLSKIGIHFIIFMVYNPLFSFQIVPIIEISAPEVSMLRERYDKSKCNSHMFHNVIYLFVCLIESLHMNHAISRLNTLTFIVHNMLKQNLWEYKQKCSSFLFSITTELCFIDFLFTYCLICHLKNGTFIDVPNNHEERAFVFTEAHLTTFVSTRKYPLHGYILGVLAHTTALDRLWGGF